MRIVIITPTFPPLKCGVGDYSCFLSLEWAKRGEEVIVLTSQYEAVIKGKNLTVTNKITNWRIWDIFKIIKRLKALSPQFISIQYESGAYQEKTAINWLPLLCRIFLPKIPVFTTFHAYHGPEHFSKINLLAISLFSKRLIVTNEVDYTKIARRATFLLKKTSQIPIGANLEFSVLKDRQRKELKQKWGIASNEFVLCFFGFILPDKGLDKLLEAVKILKEKQKTVKLLIIGGNSFVKNEVSIELEKKLKQQAHKWQISQNIIWTGYQERETVSHLLQISDLGVFLYEDGVSLRRGSLIAAIIHFLPLITTFNNTLPSYLKDGENIILTSYEDVEALAAKIEWYMDNLDKLNTIRENLKEIAPIFAWETISGKYLEEYQKEKL